MKAVNCSGCRALLGERDGDVLIIHARQRLAGRVKLPATLVCRTGWCGAETKVDAREAVSV